MLPNTEVVAAVLIAAVLDRNGRVGFTGDRAVLNRGIELYERSVSVLTDWERKFIRASITEGRPA